MSEEERNLRIGKTDFDDFNEALAWVVQAVDREFEGATMLNISVEQMMRSGPKPDDEWRYVWSASVGGALSK